jgi:Flp pilus assembly protein TadG
MKIFRDEKGQTLVLTAVCMAGLLGFMALALDVGVLYHTRRDAQTAADAAAMAGALDYLYNHSVSSAQTAACNAAGQNGISGNCTSSASDGSCTGSTTQICVNVPPKTGPNTTTAGTFVEAIVMKPQSTIFKPASVPVYARAVAALPTAGQACIWVMAPTGPALDVQGKYDIESPNCGIYVNSTSTDAMGVTGNAGTVNSTFIDVVGNATLQHQTTPTPATMNAGIRQSPWGNLSGPDSSACNLGGNTYSGKTITSSNIPPAYNGVVCFTGGSVKNPPVLSGTMTLPGADSGIVYYFQNGVEISTGSTVTFGNAITYNKTTETFNLPSSGVNPGAVLDVGNGTLTQDSNSLLNIYSPTEGSYTGIAIFQPYTNKQLLQVQFGSNNEVLDGYIYAPGAEVFLQDNGGGVTATGLVCNQLYAKSSTLTVASSYDKANPTVTLNRVLKLVE